MVIVRTTSNRNIQHTHFGTTERYTFARHNHGRFFRTLLHRSALTAARQWQSALTSHMFLSRMPYNIYICINTTGVGSTIRSMRGNLRHLVLLFYHDVITIVLLWEWEIISGATGSDLRTETIRRTRRAVDLFAIGISIRISTVYIR